jgi:hypothetical protein
MARRKRDDVRPKGKQQASDRDESGFQLVHVLANFGDARVESLVQLDKFNRVT